MAGITIELVEEKPVAVVIFMIEFANALTLTGAGYAENQSSVGIVSR